MAFTNFYYGLDTNSGGPFPCAGNGPHYYIGRLGGGTTYSTSGFDVSTAQAVGCAYTFAYWDLVGPGQTPSGSTPYQWGQQQAQAFINAWNNTSGNGQYVCGATLFADIESGNPGWGTNLTDNQQVLEGFLSYVNGYAPFDAGIYISTSNWDTYFGSGYASSQPFVFWLAGADCTLSLSDCTGAQNEFNSSIMNITRGGYRVMIWQYLADVAGCSVTQDYDITPYTGYQNSKWNPTT